jgi:hypothetical protein
MLSAYAHVDGAIPGTAIEMVSSPVAALSAIVNVNEVVSIPPFVSGIEQLDENVQVDESNWLVQPPSAVVVPAKPLYDSLPESVSVSGGRTEQWVSTPASEVNVSSSLYVPADSVHAPALASPVVWPPHATMEKRAVVASREPMVSSGGRGGGSVPSVCAALAARRAPARGLGAEVNEFLGLR